MSWRAHIAERALQVFIPGQDKLVRYRGKVATGDIKAFVLAKIPDHVAHLNSAAAVNALAHTCGAPALKGEAAQASTAGSAAWNLCAVLITDKAEAPPLLRSLALQYRGNVRRPTSSCCALRRFGARGTNERDLSQHAQHVDDLDADTRAGGVRPRHAQQ